MGLPGGTSSILIYLGSLGWSSATGTLTVDLGTEPGFVGASEIPTSIVGHVVNWDLSTMNYQAVGRLSVMVSLPGGAANGNLYPVQLSIQPTAGTDLAPGNNVQTVNVMAVAHQIFLPILTR